VPGRREHAPLQRAILKYDAYERGEYDERLEEDYDAVDSRAGRACRNNEQDEARKRGNGEDTHVEPEAEAKDVFWWTGRDIGVGYGMNVIVNGDHEEERGWKKGREGPRPEPTPVGVRADAWRNGTEFRQQSHSAA
jgi:hypothetical protein